MIDIDMDRARIVLRFVFFGPLFGGVALLGITGFDDRPGHAWALRDDPLLLMLRQPTASILSWVAQGTALGAAVGFALGCTVQAWLMGMHTLSVPFLGAYRGITSAFSALCCTAMFRPAHEA